VPVNVYFDTASYGQRAFDMASAVCGSERVLFGSDAPVMDPGTTIASLGSHFDEAAESASRLFS
jgi:predicted TIM-barrel fold metal-dependent hydrolase